MSYLIDTNIASAFIRGNRPIGQKFFQYGGLLTLSTVSRGELLTWAYRKRTAPRIRQGIIESLALFQQVPVDLEIADQFAMLHAELLDGGQPHSTFDLLIAATAMVHDLTVVTHNTVDFVRVPGLRVVDWHVE